MIPRIVQYLLGPLDRHGTFGRYEFREPDTFLYGLVFRLIHSADETYTIRLFGSKRPCRQTHVFDPAGRTDHFGQTTERADVRRHADVDLFDGEFGRARAQPDVGAGADVDG